MALAAILRATGGELARGLSTGLTVVAGCRCPACSPTLTSTASPPCPVLACPKCVCGELTRISAVCEPLPWTALAVLARLILLVGFLAGFATARLSSRPSPSRSRGGGI